MACFKLSPSSPFGSARLSGSYATEADCLQACREGACCEGTTCSVKPACQCSGTGKTFKGVGTTCADASGDSCCKPARAVSINVTFEGWTQCIGTGVKLYVGPLSVTAVPYDWTGTNNGGYGYYAPGGNGLAGLEEQLPLTHSFPTFPNMMQGYQNTGSVPNSTEQGGTFTSAFIGFELRQTATELTFQAMSAIALRNPPTLTINQIGLDPLPSGYAKCGQVTYQPCIFKGAGRVVKQSKESVLCSAVPYATQWDWIAGKTYESTFEHYFMWGREEFCAPTNSSTGTLTGFRYYGKLTVDSVQYL
jgi:hypothetical protein